MILFILTHDAYYIYIFKKKSRYLLAFNFGSLQIDTNKDICCNVKELNNYFTRQENLTSTKCVTTNALTIKPKFSYES